MTIEAITSTTEEVRVTNERKTFVFNRSGVETATGCGLTKEELTDLRTHLAKRYLCDTEKAIINLTLRDHNLPTI